MASTVERSDAPPVTKKEIFGWCMYDVADSAFTTVIVTALYAPFFSKVVVGNQQQADLLWGMAAAVSEIFVALLAPILGAIADFSGSRKKFLASCAFLIVFFTGLLYFAGPGMTALAFTLYVVANIGFAGGGVFIDSFLPGISNESNVGRISGLKWALGYMSGLVCLSLCIPLAKNIVENPTPDQLSAARLIPVVVAAYYAVAVIPTLVFLRERSVPKPLPEGDNYITVGFRQLAHTLKHVRRYGELFKLLVAFLIYNDGVVTVIYFAALYAGGTLGFTADEFAILMIIMNVVAAAGAFSFGWIADRIGQKRTIIISLWVWIAAVVLAYFSDTKSTFYAVAALAGIGMGSTQSVSRSLLALFTPKENAAEFFGFLGIAGKAMAFAGPMTFGLISNLSGSQRPAILSVGAFFVIGMLVLTTVNEQRGKEASRIPVDAPG